MRTGGPPGLFGQGRGKKRADEEKAAIQEVGQPEEAERAAKKEKKHLEAGADGEDMVRQVTMMRKRRSQVMTGRTRGRW